MQSFFSLSEEGTQSRTHALLTGRMDTVDTELSRWRCRLHRGCDQSLGDAWGRGHLRRSRIPTGPISAFQIRPHVLRPSPVDAGLCPLALRPRAQDRSRIVRPASSAALSMTPLPPTGYARIRGAIADLGSWLARGRRIICSADTSGSSFVPPAVELLETGGRGVDAFLVGASHHVGEASLEFGIGTAQGILC